MLLHQRQQQGVPRSSPALLPGWHCCCVLLQVCRVTFRVTFNALHWDSLLSRLLCWLLSRWGTSSPVLQLLRHLNLRLGPFRSLFK